MLEKYYEQYCLLEERMEKDEEMKDLRKRLEEEDKELSAVYSRLSEEDRGVICELIGLLGEIQQRTMEIAAAGLKGLL